MLNGFYEYIASEKELAWEDVRDRAGVIADWLVENQNPQLTEEAREVLREMKGRQFYLDDTQKGEMRYRFGNLATFRKALGNGVSVSRKAKISISCYLYFGEESLQRCAGQLAGQGKM